MVAFMAAWWDLGIWDEIRGGGSWESTTGRFVRGVAWAPVLGLAGENCENIKSNVIYSEFD